MYSCPATCAVVVNKLETGYIITTSLAHIDGFSKLIQVEDPTKMFELKEDSLKHICNWWTELIRDKKDWRAEMKKYEVGTKSLMDTTGVLLLTSFTNQNKLFHISTDFKKTYLTKTLKGKLKIVDTLSNKSLWSWDEASCNYTYKDMKLYSFFNNNTSGFITIMNDTISIIDFVQNSKNN